jgi:Flp pilus assembly protein TadD
MPAHGRPPEPRTASLREISAIATLLALPAATAASAADVPGREWGQLLAFGLLLGIATGLTAPDLRDPLRNRPTLAAFLAGLALLVAAPVLGYGGAASATGDGILLVGGTALLGGVAWRLRHGVGPFLPWIGGLLLLTALAVSPFVDAPPRPSGIDAAMWGLGGGLAFGAAAFVVLRRWLRSTADARLARGDAAYARREYEKAIAAYDSAVAAGHRAGVEVPAGWYGKGAALVAAGRFDEAIAPLDRALALNPGNEVGWINKGTALARLGRLRDALKCYNSAIKVNPQYEVAWNNKANALARLGKSELALACYEKALEIDPAYRTAWVNKGFVLAKLGRFEEAAACADAALRLTTGPAVSA